MKKLLICLVVILSIFLQSFTPAEVYWRDTGEFIIAAAFLDISHPAGFPLYGQLGNLFSLIPFGPITWRINLFSTLIVVINLTLAYLICWLLLVKELSLEKRFAGALSFLPVLILFFSPTYLKQAYSAEVYVLNCVFIQLLILFYLQFRWDDDLRYLILAAFTAGLAIGNHVSIGLILIPFMVIAFCSFRRIKIIVLPSLLAGLLGLSVYSYIPVRARAYPPLNTSQAVSAKRFINLISDERDRQLRGQARSKVRIKGKGLKTGFFGSLSKTFINDLKKLKKELSLAVIVAAALGLVVMVKSSFIISSIFLSIILTNWYFFKGWNPDPWIPLFFSLGIMASYLVGIIFNLGKELISLKVSYGLAITLTAGLIISCFWNPLGALFQMRDYDVPSWSARRHLCHLPPRSVYVTESSWFLLEYLQQVERYRDDLQLVYKMDILRPDLFKSVELEDPSEHSSYSSIYWLAAADQGGEGDFIRMRKFLDFVARRAIVSFEPTSDLNNYLSQLVIFNPQGFASVKFGQQGRYNPKYLESVATYLDKLKHSMQTMWPAASFSSGHYFEESLDNIARLLAAAGQRKAAISLFRDLCLPVSNSLCSVVSFNNLAKHIIDDLNYLDGAKLILKVMRQQQRSVPELRHNLAYALGKLNRQEADELRKEYPQILFSYQTGR